MEGFSAFPSLGSLEDFFSLERNTVTAGAASTGVAECRNSLSQVVNVVTESRLKLLPLLLLLLPVLNNHEKKACLTFQPPRFRPIAPIVGASLSCTHPPAPPLKKKEQK